MKRASDVGFCLTNDREFVDDLAVQQTMKLAREVRETQMVVHHLYRGREAYVLGELAMMRVERAADALAGMAADLRDILAAQKAIRAATTLATAE